jgi:hypothetical protein
MRREKMLRDLRDHFVANKSSSKEEKQILFITFEIRMGLLVLFHQKTKTNFLFNSQIFTF